MGHATRCIPIIKALLTEGFEPILASDGDALLLLKKEFPTLKIYHLPSYNIRYAKNSKFFMIKLFLSVPFVLKAIKNEHKIVQNIIEKENLKGIISDNRFGVYSNKIPSIYITHQLQVLSGITTKITSKIHQKIIKKFDECWVPDTNTSSNLSGKLGRLKKQPIPTKYIGILSRFKPKKINKKYDILVLLSGPEPQRGLLETRLLQELNSFNGNILFVRGVFNKTRIHSTNKFIEIKNHLLSSELEAAIIESNMVIARSGYSTIMDLAALGKKAFFIPTPGQKEQEYLAKYLHEKNIAPFSTQENFNISMLKKIEAYNGFNKSKINLNLEIFSGF